MRRRILTFFLLTFPFTASAGTLRDLLAKEEGVDFGECPLTPKPKLSGTTVHAVLPARFPDEAVWQTRTLLLVGANGEQVTETLELALPDGFNPRESNVICQGDTITLREETRGTGKPKVRRYRWDGAKLTAKR